MAIQRFKVALNNALFPLVSTKAQRAAFVPGLDAAPRTPRIFMGEDESVDYNLSQVIYAENVMPVAEGIHSVGYRQLIAPTINAIDDRGTNNLGVKLNVWKSESRFVRVNSKYTHHYCTLGVVVQTSFTETDAIAWGE